MTQDEADVTDDFLIEQSLMPSELLQEMRAVSKGCQPILGYDFLILLKRDKPMEFITKLELWEDRWRGKVARILRERKGNPVEAKDEPLEDEVRGDLAAARKLRAEQRMAGGDAQGGREEQGAPGDAP